MTMIIGIETTDKKEGIVIYADRQLSLSDDNGDEVSTRRPMTKVYHGDYWAGVATGEDDPLLGKFWKTLKGDRRVKSDPENAREIINQAVNSQHFEEIAELNRDIVRRNDGDIDCANQFLFATRNPKISLWRVDEFGNMYPPSDDLDFPYIAIGSPEVVKAVDSYIERLLGEEKINRDSIDLGTANLIGWGAHHEASKIEGVGMGYDFVIMDKKKLRAYGERVRVRLRSVEESELERIGLEWNGN